MNFSTFAFGLLDVVGFGEKTWTWTLKEKVSDRDTRKAFNLQRAVVVIV